VTVEKLAIDVKMMHAKEEMHVHNEQQQTKLV